MEFGSGSRILTQFRYGSRVKLSILKEKIKINFKEKISFRKNIFFNNYSIRTKSQSTKEIFTQLSL